MRRWYDTAVILASVAALSSVGLAERSFPPATPESQGLSSEALAELADTVRDYLQRDLIVGAELLVIKNRRTVLHETFGGADREDEVAWSKGTICNIRSMTKTLTGAAAQLLIDRGQLRLDDRVADYVPGFDNAAAGDITVEQLLTHRSGLPLTILEAVDEFESLAAQADAVGARGPEFDPGSRFWYSDAGSDVLGAVVAAASGRSLAEFVETELLVPLGMSASFYGTDADDDRFDRIASLYIGGAHNWTRFWKHGDGPFYPFAWGSQTLYGTPTDYAMFLAMWMDGGRVGERQLLSADAIARTLKPASPMSMLGSDERMPTFFPELEVYYGQMSVLHVPLDPGPDARPVIIGHSGSDGTMAWAWPDRDLMILYFTQSRGGMTVLRLEEVIDRLLLHPERYVETEEVPAELAPYLGVYVANFATFIGEEFEVLFRNGTLALDIPSQMTFELVETEEAGRWRFAMTDAIEVSFGRDDAGAVNLLEVHQAGMTFEVPRQGTALAAAQAIADAVDPALAETLIGTYHDAENDRDLEVFLKEDVLSITVPPGVVLQLRQMADDEGRWQIRQQPVVTVTFQQDETGATTSMTIHTPDETVVMPRVEPAGDEGEAEQSYNGGMDDPTSTSSETLPEIQPLWDYDDPAATEATFRAILPEAEAQGDRGYQAELLTQIARAEGLQRRFDDARATLDRAETLIDPTMHRARVRLLLERGRVLNSSGKRDEARPLFLEAWESARAAELDGLAVDAAHMVAIVEGPDAALEWNERALALAESSADPDARRWTGSLHNNIGWTYHGDGDYERALTHFETALAARREAGKPADVRVARWCVARCLRSLGRTEAALAIQRELERETAGVESPDGYVPEEIAECLLVLGRADEARPYFRRAHELLAADPWLAENEPDRIERLRRLGEEP